MQRRPEEVPVDVWVVPVLVPLLPVEGGATAGAGAGAGAGEGEGAGEDAAGEFALGEGCTTLAAGDGVDGGE